jgi:sulfite reductase alpha subunit-like flavoprotein
MLALAHAHSLFIDANADDLKKADDLLTKMSKEGRYQKDVWY